MNIGAKTLGLTICNDLFYKITRHEVDATKKLALEVVEEDTIHRSRWSHLKTKYGGHLLIAVGKDENDRYFHLVIAIVETETKDSWR
ncbi:hypothetical protein CR513_37714, partial [Mucuna pruriens]